MESVISVLQLNIENKTQVLKYLIRSSLCISKTNEILKNYGEKKSVLLDFYDYDENFEFKLDFGENIVIFWGFPWYWYRQSVSNRQLLIKIMCKITGIKRSEAIFFNDTDDLINYDIAYLSIIHSFQYVVDNYLNDLNIITDVTLDYLESQDGAVYKFGNVSEQLIAK